jgi:hypothetical protein
LHSASTSRACRPLEFGISWDQGQSSKSSDRFVSHWGVSIQQQPNHSYIISDCSTEAKSGFRADDRLLGN